MENKQILLVGLGDEARLVREAMKGQQIEIRTICAGHMNITVGEAFTGDLPLESDQVMKPTVIMFRGFDREELDPVLRDIRQAGLSHQPLKAMVTATNWSWNLQALYEELKEEQQVMAALIRLQKLRNSMPLPDFMDIPAMRARIQAENLLKGGEGATLEAIEKAYENLKRFQK